jgi:POT family proton-dependent oligopeptide transporter
MVAQLYPEGGSRRDAGFSIFYVGINIGAFLGSLLVPLCAARFGWRWAFGLPAVGMLLGLLQFTLTRQWLGAAGLDTERRPSRASWLAVIVFVVAVATVAALIMTGMLTIDPGVAATALSWLIALLAAVYFLYLILLAGLTAVERGRVYVMLALFSGYAAFFAAFEQGGASFNLFADRYTDLHLLGWRMPAGVLQATTPLVTILFAPVFAALWIALGKRGKDPSPPAKFATGFALQSLGFLVMYVASQYVVAGQKILPTWLLFTYLFQEWGDLCLGPVGLSAMSKLAPRRFVGQVMGVWFLALALGNNLSGQVSRLYDAANLESLPNLFMGIFWCGLGAAGILWLLTPTLKRLMAGAK